MATQTKTMYLADADVALIPFCVSTTLYASEEDYLEANPHAVGVSDYKPFPVTVTFEIGEHHVEVEEA